MLKIRGNAAIVLTLIATSLIGLSSPSQAADGLDASTLGMRPSGGFLKQGRLDQYEAALGQPIQWYVAMAGRGSPNQMRSATYGQVRADDAVLPTIADRINLVMTIPLAFGDANAKTVQGRADIRRNLVETASGRWDEEYRLTAQSLIEGGFADATIRLGHEFSGDWYPWSAPHTESQYIAAYRHVHEVLSQESPDFTFEWTGARVSFIEFGPDAYPGDDVVDIIGLDIYNALDLNHSKWTRQYESVLVAHRDFAIEHGKPVAYSEWANRSIDEPEYIQRMYDWFVGLPDAGGGSLLYQSYFNASEDRFDLDRYPHSKQRYLELFGVGGDDADASVGPDSVVVTAGESVSITSPIPGDETTWWKKEGGSIAWANKSGPVAVATFDATGTYVLGVRALVAGAVVRSTVTVDVVSEGPGDGPPDEPVPVPVAAVPSTMTATVGESIVIETDLRGSISWFKVSGPSMSWQGRATASPTVTFRSAGSYVLGVRSDVDGDTSRYRVAVTVTG